MKAGDIIIILPSQTLINLGLEGLAGKSATIVDVNGSFDKIKGCWVKLNEEFMGEAEWYIPYYSIGI